MAAPQGWSRLYDDAPEHPKFVAAGHKAAWLYVCGQAYSSKHETDGAIPKAMVPRLSDVPAPARQAAILVEVGLWHDRGDHFEQHDYVDMQTTAAERQAARDDARDRQRRSRARHSPVTRDSERESQSPSRDSSATEVEVEVEVEDPPPSTTSRVAPPRTDRASRLPDGWTPQPEPDLVQAVGGEVAARRERAKFGDYWAAKPGKDGRKVDWQATWRNWLRRAAEDRTPNGTGARASPPEVGSDEWEERRRQDEARAEQILGGDSP